MKLDKTNVCVFIENEAQLQQARELLERYGERISRIDIYTDSKYNHISNYNGQWRTYCVKNLSTEIPITLSELEEILKGEKDEQV